jgi:Carboxypeptidase regulatory-like domain
MFHQLVLTIVVLLAARTAGAQISGLPPRDTPLAPQADTAAIKGRVVDGQSGSPLARARVRLHGPGGLQRTVLTDESGTFAFTALPAGSYSLNADKSTYLQGRYPESGHTLRSNAKLFFPLLDGQVLNGGMSLFHGGAISGRVVDSHGEPVELANVQVMRVPRSGGGRPAMRSGGVTNDLGEFRVPRLEPGNYLLLVQPRRDVQEDGPSTQSVPTLYPGVLLREQALPITIDRSASVTGVDLALVDGTMSRVTGTLIDSTSGRPAIGGFVSVRAIVAGLPEGFDAASAPVKPDGTFELRLAPGEYQIEGRAIRPGTVGPLQAGDERIGMARVAVAGEADSDVTIVLGRGAAVTGQVVFEGRTPTPPMPSNPGQFRVSFGSPEGTGCRMGQSDLGANWTFRVDGLLGRCVARVDSSLGRLTVKAVMINDVDLMDQPVTFESGQQLRNVQVIVTDKRTDLTFQVADDRGQPTREYVALVFSTDKARWVENSRYIRPFVPAPPPPEQALDVTELGAVGGAFAAPPAAIRDSVTGLPPGDYYVVALDDLESEAVRDPAVLDSLSRPATRITLTDSAPAEVSLRLVKLADLAGGR